jgi:sec-independent protein translocase protein TatB
VVQARGKYHTTNSRIELPHLPSRIYDDQAMSFSDTVFLFFLALILFGPKKFPEMARQAGKLLAELRRASNEFRSQIESEIAHLEVEKSQTILPPSPPPRGTVASLSMTSATSEPVHNESPGTLAGPAVEAPALTLNAADSSTADAIPPEMTSAASSISTPSVEPAIEAGVPAPQEPHV